MAHAWLDSLSEDWVSQPRSDASYDQLPNFSSSRANTNRRVSREPLSRIPRLNAGSAAVKRPQQSTQNSSAIHALNERSSNEINIRSSQRGSSKTSQENKASQRGRYLSRSVSASTAGSVVHNTVQHSKSQSTSPSKARENVPEWKKRLVYGELNYGESKDLFSSAGTGLENMFRPPVAQEPAGDETIENFEVGLNETTLPSSPPPYSRFAQHQTQEDESYEQPANDSIALQSPIPPKQMKFRRTEDDIQESSRIGSLTSDGHYDSEEGGTNEPSEQSAISPNPDNDPDSSRKVSGQSVIRNEDLSPILISRHNSEDGKVIFAPVELPAEQLHRRLEVLRKNQMLLDSEPNSRLEPESATVAEGSQKFEDTDDFVKNGGFLNIQRGGRSAEGSFRRRPLSPPLNIDTSEMLPESSLQASTPKQFPTIRIDRVASNERSNYPQSPLSPAIPPPPYPSPEKRSQPPSGQSGSPLKLFGPYDTFTNQTLLRRISQFEDPMSDGTSRSMGDDTIALPTQESPSKSEVNKGFMTESSPKKASQHDPNCAENLDGVSTFGAGELDGYEFSEDITQSSMDYSRFTNKENMMPAEDSLPPSHFVKFQIHQDLSLENTSLNVQRRRNKLPSNPFSPRRSAARSRASNSSRPQSSSHPSGPNYGVQATPKRDGSDGKRPRPSPSKDPTPKRRRTLHRSDIAYGLEDRPTVVESVQSSHRTMQSVIGKKRQNLSQDELQEPASPSVLATRQIIRPRSPTPGQRAARERQPLGSLHINPDHRNGVSDISVQDFAIDGSGRTSMKTQDFFDAAEEIMAMIRNKARPKNGLSSVEESEAESAEQRNSSPDGVEESSFQESTKEPFSRPPSREGPPLTRAPTRQEDPELMIRLKKYEEGSDLGEIITNSMQSMGRIREAINEANSLSESIRQSVLSGKGWDSPPHEQEVVSDLPNVRISRNPDRSEFSENTVEFPSNGSQTSGTVTSRSIPTGSSQGSDSKRLIVPDVVTPLIGNQVGNMVFDKEKNVWYKVRQPKPDNRNILPSEDSEDPFGSIPDLSVDIAKETQHLGRAMKQNSEGSEQSLLEETPPRPSTAKPSTTVQESPNGQTMTNHMKEAFTGTKQTLEETAVEDDKEIEHEITIHEDRMQKSSPSRKRNLTISFSSPIASVIQDVAHQSDDDNAGQEPGPTNEPVEHVATDSLRDSLRRGRGSKSPRSVSNSAARSRSRSRSAKNLSVKGQDFVPRPVSRIDEQDEDTVEIGEHAASEERQISIRGESSLVYPDNERNPNTSLSVVVTPAPAKTSSVSATPIIGQYVGCLSLSPLSDFTMHQADQSCGLEVSYVVGDRYLATGDGSKKIMSKAIQNLVEKITEVEPFEPDWESMNELDINDKQLTTLHMLDEFCTSVVTLNASNNSIEHLDGVPSSVRNLRITHNHLSELTAWGHLMNLQYVDVSNNQIRSLHAFKDLVHLRSLRADDNQITSLDGIKMHDSLQVLRARRNLLTEVNLDGTKLQRLTELDLQMNEISSIHGIEQLTCLVTLNLQHNSLPFFGPTMDVEVPNLKYLTLSSNDLTDLDLAPFPSLRLLHADRNQLTTVTGFSRCRRLDSLSLREQQGDAPLDVSFLNAAYEVRKLFLSGNLLASFDPSVDFLNLQLLELANCGLQSLPADLGQLMPNLRVLNLNMNAIDDVAALRYIPRLKKLLVAGNRLADAAQVADVLSGFPHLSRLDARDNPATQGFYAPIQALVPMNEDAGFDAFTLPDADPARDAQFASRSDLGTRMRRRVYDMVVLDRCRRLRMLDGLPVQRGRDGGAATTRDKVWEALVRGGVVQDAEAEAEAEAENEEDGRSEASSQ
ncbi:hypothetical protein F4818DRAFT_396354 [Hypoxylon cercidicola]|nr:hypothetical protein F4818DRAFT_396354 [Hypoxylon cercidicola]